ncbi:hypothetical protein CJF32_00000571 [Rutstroemia sp. NJR-2017a WRK4]|nr:hypothetical protein CJF32_00000571 [Rutstroemia sp. NJR-2017a WRK4]
MSETKRPLLKGSLRPPKVNPSNLSYTQPPASRDELSIGAQGKNVKVVEFNSSAIPQPFLDPSIVQKRAQMDREWQLRQEKTARASRDQAASSSTGD